MSTGKGEHSWKTSVSQRRIQFGIAKCSTLVAWGASGWSWMYRSGIQERIQKKKKSQGWKYNWICFYLLCSHECHMTYSEWNTVGNLLDQQFQKMYLLDCNRYGLDCPWSFCPFLFLPVMTSWGFEVQKPFCIHWQQQKEQCPQVGDRGGERWKEPGSLLASLRYPGLATLALFS